MRFISVRRGLPIVAGVVFLCCAWSNLSAGTTWLTATPPGLVVPSMDHDQTIRRPPFLQVRTPLLWNASEYQHLLRVLRRLPRNSERWGKYNVSVCLRYEHGKGEGLGNQWLTHNIAMVTALLLGTDSIAVPPARCRERADTRRPKWRDVNPAEVFDRSHFVTRLREMGLTAHVMRPCPIPDFTFPVKSEYTLYSLERTFLHKFISYLADHESTGPVRSPQFRATAPVDLEQYYAAVVRRRRSPSVLRVNVTVWLTAEKSNVMYLFPRAPHLWPSHLFRAVISTVRFLPPPFHLPPRYGVFHLRAEGDNIWSSAEAQLEEWTRLRRKVHERYGEMPWYVASGMYQSHSFNISVPLLRRTWEAVEEYRRSVQNYTTAEDHNASVRAWSVERRASMDYAIGVRATVVVGLLGSSYSPIVAQLRWNGGVHAGASPGVYVFRQTSNDTTIVMTRVHILLSAHILDKNVPESFYTDNDIPGPQPSVQPPVPEIDSFHSRERNTSGSPVED